MSPSRHIADQLHDGPQQLLVSVGLRLRLLEEDAPDAWADELAELVRQVELALDQLRAVETALRSPD